MAKKIQSALISVFYKDGLDKIAKLLHENDVQVYSTGGTQKFIEDLGIPVTAVEDLTSYPSIFGGRVKTLHPKVFGGILHRRENEDDVKTAAEFEIPAIDLVIVDLYPFEETVASGASEDDIIEKIDIGGIALIRGAAKNYQDVLIVSNRDQYDDVYDILKEKGCGTDLEDRKHYAMKAFGVSSHYDSAIHGYFSGAEGAGNFRAGASKTLRYGENPHQAATFYGDLDAMFDQIHGKELSYNNLMDTDAAVRLIDEFDDLTFVIMKHNNACGVASAATTHEAYKNALACDPVSAFGGVLITNSTIDKATAEEMHSLFFEILVAPAFDQEALDILTKKKDRRLLIRKDVTLGKKQYRTLLNGVLEQDKDMSMEGGDQFNAATEKKPTDSEVKALEFALKICKHLKSNNVVLAKEGQLLACGVGQTSRVDALKQAIDKAKEFGFDLNGAVMASEAFFPFPDCVEIGHNAGITAVVQPGGSIRDQLSIDYCNENGVAMVMTGVRHFLH
ncbi:bifunctional phosphoribosylaminoimidazolecarboxamide formyltransferase/IMP cyclohydrolase [Jiulongibacter sediminis]|uniref:Bifunctional purine biosynthesis protein PurH n=1 Tax=Jiulongibacter sediminis TaxID=1605367 RepID=A0A0P7C5L8_9BACT|nr:bifunctional phosphoribosylaminoimidazolecarboxamide formyltransferase/IMP cyclohydrolase [Jiulongibacter sediminis]KPM48610.1 phosphoribosylaminoimidazolecarboxamide formyltransferase [Jiulongibacter sediminis]TBX25148.1 phosphoribosylaminoimidazolecarboxamide formyltransferase [Jiulongibacter sediminis]